MTAHEIIKSLCALAGEVSFTKTCDTVKAGDEDRAVTKVAVCMFATPNVIRQAVTFGAELLITHEPTYYDHMDVHKNEAVENAKRKLLEDSGIVLWRYHDYAHAVHPDVINVGVADTLELDAKIEYIPGRDTVRFQMNTPITALELAKILEDKLGIKHPRICGAYDIPSKNVSLMCGTPGGTFDELKSDGCNILLTGEACEWGIGEYARDAAELGFNKTLIIMGHIGSERDGMKYTAEMLRRLHPELDVKYLECGEVYRYTDSF